VDIKGEGALKRREWEPIKIGRERERIPSPFLFKCLKAFVVFLHREQGEITEGHRDFSLKSKKQ